MDKFHGFVLLGLLLASISAIQMGSSEARPLSILQPAQQSYSKIFATLGVVCKCCDGTGGECSSTWTQPCSQLKCVPWKLH